MTHQHLSPNLQRPSPVSKSKSFGKKGISIKIQQHRQHKHTRQSRVREFAGAITIGEEDSCLHPTNRHLRWLCLGVGRALWENPVFGCVCPNPGFCARVRVCFRLLLNRSLIKASCLFCFLQHPSLLPLPSPPPCNFNTPLLLEHKPLHHRPLNDVHDDFPNSRTRRPHPGPPHHLFSLPTFSLVHCNPQHGTSTFNPPSVLAPSSPHHLFHDPPSRSFPDPRRARSHAFASFEP